MLVLGSGPQMYGKSWALQTQRGYGAHNDWAAQMLQQGFSADSADYDGRTALMLAAAKGHADVAVALISAGADVLLRDNLKRKPLLEACVYGHSEIIELLTRQGATCA